MNIEERQVANRGRQSWQLCSVVRVLWSRSGGGGPERFSVDAFRADAVLFQTSLDPSHKRHGTTEQVLSIQFSDEVSEKHIVYTPLAVVLNTGSVLGSRPTEH